MQHSRQQQAIGQICTEMASLPGKLGFYYQNLVTGFEAGVNQDNVFSAASVIKLPLYLHILKQCNSGELRMNDLLTITAGDKVPICGALTLFTGDVQADVQTLCRLMISISDNTATNALIRYAGLERIADGFVQMGLNKTKLTRFLFDQRASQAGLRNVISPREMGQLLKTLYRREFVSAQVSQEALDLLLLQQVDHKLNGKICGEVPIAHKTGEDDHLSNDVGIVFARQPFVICFAGEQTDVYAWEDLMRRGTWALYRAAES